AVGRAQPARPYLLPRRAADLVRDGRDAHRGRRLRLVPRRDGEGVEGPEGREPDPEPGGRVGPHRGRRRDVPTLSTGRAHAAPGRFRAWRLRGPEPRPRPSPPDPGGRGGDMLRPPRLAVDPPRSRPPRGEPPPHGRRRPEPVHPPDAGRGLRPARRPREPRGGAGVRRGPARGGGDGGLRGPGRGPSRDP